jgi:hypothetical protein
MGSFLLITALNVRCHTFALLMCQFCLHRTLIWDETTFLRCLSLLSYRENDYSLMNSLITVPGEHVVLKGRTIGKRDVTEGLSPIVMTRSNHGFSGIEQ